MIYIYSDGAYSSSRNRGGIGLVFVKGNVKLATFNKAFSNTTNNQMELAAIIIAIKTIIKNDWKDITIMTDSQYVIGCATKGWKRTKNIKLWYRYDLLKEELDKRNIKINFQWVHGHDGDHYNELADKLAVMASHELDFTL